MTSYLLIPSADGTPSRRVDFGTIASLFAEDETVVVAPPRRLFRIGLSARALVALLSDVVGTLRDEAQAPRPAPQTIVRAFGA